MLRQRLGSHLRQLLFGSRARGDAQDGSDYDMLVVVDQRTPELRAVILEVESQLMERYGALVATVLRSETEWQQLQGFPLARTSLGRGASVRPELTALLTLTDEKPRAAGLLFAGGAWGAASSRAYYAAFHAVSAALLSRGETYSRHGQVLEPTFKESG